MSKIPEGLYYAKSHEWVKQLDDNLLQVGITEFAQQELGDLVYIELPKVGRHLSKSEQCAVVESVKTASDLYSPVTGVVELINEKTVDDPAVVNEDSYTHWLFTIRADNISDVQDLMDAQGYQEYIDD